MRVVTTALGLAMSAVVVAGCTPGDAPEASVDLTQQVYVAAVVGDAVPDAAVLPWARFEPGGRVVGWDGCNSQWATYTDGRLDQVGHTDAGCLGDRSPQLWDAGVVEVSDGGNTVVLPGEDGARHEFRALIDSAPSVSLAGAWALSGERVLELRDDATAVVAACGLEGTWSEGEQVVIDLPVVSANECLPDTALFDGTPLMPTDVVGTSGAILRRLDLPLEGPHAVQLARRVA